MAWGILPHLGLYAIFTLRTYAIYQKSWFVLIFLGLTSMTTCIIDVTCQNLAPLVIAYNIGPHIFCATDDSTVRPITKRLEFAGVILALALDILVFGFTFAKTISHTLEMRRVGLGNGLGYFILRDGTMYFLFKLMIAVLATFLFFVPVPFGIGTWLGVPSVIGNPVALILASRLVLNLRQVSCKQEVGAPTLQVGAIDTIRYPVFATNSLLGNIGAQLRVGPDDRSDIEEIFMDDVEF